ncbi:uncharacterized protein LOC131672213 [Phymastichus coffea]|uniref:uncharacterized protein LOC131672213 n=1 Tax=Phymastichus coffea TaxID=108790 RepID=UPI00273C7DE4|nr:uncharacterized protein LOC131672213 [Phymastichus coffea]
MENAKRQKSVQRALFTKCLNTFVAKCNNATATADERSVALQLLETRMQELEVTNSKYVDLLSDSTAEDDDIVKEIEAHDEYKKKFLEAKVKYLREICATRPPTSDAGANNQAVQNYDKPYKRPTLDVPKYPGGVDKWLQFWSFFRKYHEDVNLSKEVKLEYLKGMMQPGSKAFGIVDGYPTTAQNYDLAFESLKSRYGRDDLLIEFYTRELLTLTIQNATRKKEDQLDVASIYDKLSARIRALDTLGVKTDNCATMLYPLVESSLPEEVLRTWQRFPLSTATDNDNNTRGAPVSDRLTKLLEFLKIEVTNEERINLAINHFAVSSEEKQEKPKEGKQKESKVTSSKEVATASALFSSERKSMKCIFCGENHDNSSCENARKISFDVRKKAIKENNCCFKCLIPNHRSSKCKVKITCAWCGNRHSILVCPDLNKESNSEKPQKSDTSEKSERPEQNLASFCSSPDVYLQTLRVVLYSETKQKVARVVIDQGSQRSYIRFDVAKLLGYESIGKREVTHALFGGANSSTREHDIYLIRMKSLENNYACNFQVMDEKVICSDIPRISRANWIDELKTNNIFLSDLETNSTYSNDLIDVLIGADVAGKLFTGNKYDLRNGLTAFESNLGWVVMGKVPSSERKDCALNAISMFVSEAKVSDLWNLDVLGIKDPIEKNDELEREHMIKENFIKTVCFKNDRYSVDLPWVDDHAPVCTNLDLCKSRLDSTVKKLHKNNLYKEYDKVLMEWLDQGIIEPVPNNELDDFSHCLAHRPVIKPGSTTPVRPVFDASSSEKGFPALNKCLEKGPNLIELIPDALLRFRENEIGVIADIRKAFLQIGINEKDRNYLRFLWFLNDQLTIFRHRCVVFGLTCSPFLLMAVIEYHLSHTIHERFPNLWSKENIDKLAKSFYVDNCVTSARTTDELNSFINEAKEIMAKGGFELRGWEYTNDGAEKEITQVLGILFNKSRDTLLINPSLFSEYNDEITKRIILSAAHKVFDPIGFTSPVTLMPKLILKKLCESKVDWDTQVDDQTKEEFLSWHEQLIYLSKIEIPRKLGSGRVSLHTFADASKTAYGAVTYLRIETENGVEIRLLAAKARVAPKNATIPRLELLAASIAVRQTAEILKILSYEDIDVFVWFDSMVVLAWILRDKQWGTFVWNRIREIRRLSLSYKFRYVPGTKNPADLPSRGCQAKQLLESRWWEGPPWLRESPENWPNSSGETDEDEVSREMKKSAQIAMSCGEIDFSIIDKFSSYQKLIKFFTIMLRFKDFLVNKKSIQRKYVTYREVYNVERKFLICIQQQMFLPKNDPKLTTLQTFIHTDGLIRLKTRISERNDKFPFLYPILLNNNHRCVELIIMEEHEKMCHAGVQAVMCQLRDRYWILSMRKTVRKVISKCVVCKRFSAKPMQADSPPLQLKRVKDSDPFETVGIDFAGPLFLNGQQKGWICLFTCAVYRAVHLELVTSLSTKTFLWALRRFINRQRRPTDIYCDNGTNFVGADNALKKLNWDVINSYSTAQRITWNFNPPSAPWWGGWWERLVGMVKVILRKVLGRRCISYEEMYTILSDCESTINARPLTYVSDAVDDLVPLTPGMFLRNNKTYENPDLDILNKIDLNFSYKQKQEIMEHLRQRFRKEYLGQLILKSNSMKSFQPLKIGDVVLIGDDNKKRIDWPLAKIEKLIQGRDGIARVAVLKTKDGVLKRPLQRIYPLEISCDDKDEANEFRERQKSVSAEANQKKVQLEQVESTVKTKSGRIVKKPCYYK